MERRFTQRGVARITLSERQEGESPSIVGYASVFFDGTEATEFELWPGVRERVMPSAFDRALAERHDVRALYNHNPSNLLARSSAGTLKLSVDNTGLRYVISPAKTALSGDVVEHIRAGNLTGSSFAFTIRSETWRIEDDLHIRQINDVELWDVGPVTFPAYEGTTTQIGRASDSVLSEARASHERWRASRKIARVKVVARAREVAAKTA